MYPRLTLSFLWFLSHWLWHDLRARTVFMSSWSPGFYICFAWRLGKFRIISVQDHLGPGAGAQDDSRANSKRWDSAEVKILVAAFKAHNNDLKSAKGSRGKKAIWEKIFAEFKQACDESSICSEKSLAQAKEKWRALFEKYKAVCDSNSKTGRGRESFEFYEIMDEFLGCSDKVRPRFVRETAVRNADVNSSVQEESTSEINESGDAENFNQHASHDGHDEAAPTTTAAASHGHKQQKLT